MLGNIWSKFRNGETREQSVRDAAGHQSFTDGIGLP